MSTEKKSATIFNFFGVDVEIEKIETMFVDNYKMRQSDGIFRTCLLLKDGSIILDRLWGVNPEKAMERYEHSRRILGAMKLIEEIKDNPQQDV